MLSTTIKAVKMRERRKTLHHRAYMKEYLAKYKKTKKNKSTAKKWRDMVKLIVIGRYGGKCRHCQFTDIRALCLDHKRGGGERARIATKLSGIRLYVYLYNRPKDKTYQVLCANCNLIKAFEKGELNGVKKIWGKRYRRYELVPS